MTASKAWAEGRYYVPAANQPTPIYDQLLAERQQAEQEKFPPITIDTPRYVLQADLNRGRL
ncbi:MAG: hypothetical protein WB777_14165 [Mycobacterium sp.]